METAQPTPDVPAMFDGIAARYDLINSLMSFGLHRSWRRATTAAVLGPLDASGTAFQERLDHPKVLDLAAGTGTSSISLVRAGADVTACDLSEGMAAVARRRYPNLEYILGDGTDLPFYDATFDAVTCSFGLRNMPDVDQCLRELHRVTKPGGRLVILEFSTPTNPIPRAAYRHYLTRLIPSIGGVVSGRLDTYRYFAQSIADWPDQVALAERIRAAGWQRVQYRNLTGGIVALHRAVR